MGSEPVELEVLPRPVAELNCTLARRYLVKLGWIQYMLVWKMLIAYYLNNHLNEKLCLNIVERTLLLSHNVLDPVASGEWRG